MIFKKKRDAEEQDTESKRQGLEAGDMAQPDLDQTVRLDDLQNSSQASGTSGAAAKSDRDMSEDEPRVFDLSGADTVPADKGVLSEANRKAESTQSKGRKAERGGSGLNPSSVGIPTAQPADEGDKSGLQANKKRGATRTGSVPKIVTKVEYTDYQPMQVRLMVSRIEPWTVMKVTLLLSVCFGIAMILAGILIWLLLNSMHVFSSVEDFINDIDPTGAVAQLIDYIRLPRVVAITTILAVANVILMTAFTTVGALLYNLSSSLVGGIKVALTDD